LACRDGAKTRKRRAFDFVPSLYNVDDPCTFARESRDPLIEITVEYGFDLFWSDPQHRREKGEKIGAEDARIKGG
jgi:hypothetical protein